MKHYHGHLGHPQLGYGQDIIFTNCYKSTLASQSYSLRPGCTELVQGMGLVFNDMSHLRSADSYHCWFRGSN